MNKNKGLFITVEGGEGVGKSTNMAYIETCLQAASINFVLTREPGGTAVAEKVRSILLEKTGENINSVSELLLIFAARSQHLSEFISPALEKGQWVLCDRFTDATYAYQGGGREMDETLIGQLENIVQAGTQPDYTILLDAPVEIGMERAQNRGELDRFEQEELAFFSRVRNKYLEMAEGFPQRYRVINASRPLKEVQAQLGAVIKTIIDERCSSG